MPVTARLHVRVMGDSWIHVAEPISRLHATHTISCAHGTLRIEQGSHPLVWLFARLLRLPQPSAAAETRLVITARANGEHWARTFNGRCIQTMQYESEAGDLAERFGILEFRFRLQVSGGSLLYLQREAALLCGPVRLAIPRSWAPRVEAREEAAGPARIQVTVRVLLPVIGLLISYAGIVEVVEAHP